MRENICKRCDQQGVNIQNIHKSHTTQYQKTKPSQKCAQDPNIYFSKEYIQMANRLMKRCSASLILNPSEVPPHNDQNGYHQKVYIL